MKIKECTFPPFKCFLFFCFYVTISVLRDIYKKAVECTPFGFGGYLHILTGHLPVFLFMAFYYRCLCY